MKQYFKLFIIAVMLVACSSAAWAQPQSGNNRNKKRISREQLAEKQARYIAETMAMDDDVADRFVATYCQYQKEVWALGPKSGKSRHRNGDAATDAQTGEQIQADFERSQKILELRQKYYKEYSKFLTQKQISKVYELERKSLGRLANRSRGNRK